MAETTKGTRSTKQPRVFKGDAQTVYTNDVRIEWNAWDFKMRFGQIGEIGADGVVINRMVDVVLSPQHALALVSILSRQLKSYEDTIGPIPRAGAAVTEHPDEVVEVQGERKSLNVETDD